MRALVAILVLLITAPVSAQDYGARVRPAGLDTLTEVALDRIPPVFSIERMDPVLFDCPGDDLIAHVPATDVSLNFSALDIRTEDGLIVLSTTIDIAVATTVILDNANACLGTATCDLTADLQNLGIVVQLAAATRPEGGIEFHGAMVDLALTADDLALESAGCVAGEVATWLFNAFETWALDLLTPRLEALIGERLGGALTGLFAETVGVSIEHEGLTIDATLDALDFSRLQGVTVGGGVELTWTGPAIYEDPSPPVEAPMGEALPADFVGDFEVAISDRLVTDALYEAWRGGLIRRLLADQSRSIELAGDGIAQSIGLTPGTRLDISFDIERPLTVSFGRVGPNVAEMGMEQLHVTIDAVPPSGPTSTIEIYASGSAQVALTMGAEVGGMVMDVRDMDMTSIRVETSNETLELSGARLSAMIESTVAPMLAQRLTGLPVAPGVHAIAGMIVHVRAIESSEGWQRVGLDLIIPDPTDDVPPETSLSAPADLVAAGTAAFGVSGTDNSTPEELLRYRAWVDGTPLNEGAASSIRLVRFDATAGEHTLEVAAIDLNDNQDATPVVHVFTVDGNPPVLEVTRSPGAIVAESTIEADWIASDPEGAVESRWVLREVGDDGLAAEILAEPFGADAGTLSISTGTLRNNTLYELEIIVRDAAGNLTSATFGFAFQGNTGSCSISPVGGSDAPVFLLALVFALVFVRRQRVA